MTTRSTPLWPFPGQESPRWEHYPPHNLPPPRFAVGDCVETRWGRAALVGAGAVAVVGVIAWGLLTLWSALT